jgi:thiamine phosphate synthase YjbQ (UPF0047 family)
MDLSAEPNVKVFTVQRTIQLSTNAHNGLCDITHQVEAIVDEIALLTPK